MDSESHKKLKPGASYLLSLAMFSLAAALTYFTYEISVISRQVPGIMLMIENTSEKIEPLVDEVSEIVVLLPSILDEVEATRQLVPPILEEFEESRKQIPSILQEVARTREQIPLILDESAAIRQQLPAVLASTDNASAAVVDVAAQIEAITPLVPDVLQEVKDTRESIPPLMDRADMLIDKARVAGKEASQGAVTGLFKGILMAPFALVGDVGRRMTGMSESEAKELSHEDFQQIEQGSLYLLNKGEMNEVRQWKNTVNNTHGTIKLIDIYESDDFIADECRTLSIMLYKKDDEIKKVKQSFCKNDDDKWDFDR